MIEITDLTKRYGELTVLDQVSVRIPRGGVVALVGPNGAGKSTLISSIGRLVEVDEGTITVEGLDVPTTPSEQLARRLAILRQDNHVPVRLTVRELVEFGRFPYARGRLTPTDHEMVEWSIARLELAPFASRRLDQLSGGQRQRAFIAMVLCQDTDYVLLDEPLNNLDMRHAVQTMALVRTLADELDKTIVVVLHDINMAAGYADRIVAMRDGRIVADGAPRTIIDAALIRHVFGIDLPVRSVGEQPVVMFFAPPPSAAAADRGTAPTQEAR